MKINFKNSFNWKYFLVKNNMYLSPVGLVGLVGLLGLLSLEGLEGLEGLVNEVGLGVSLGWNEILRNNIT